MLLSLSGIPLVIISIIAFILIIGLIILVHEGGHFYFAKKAGILCHEFSIGMGPVIYQKKFGETRFCIRAIPIGGFVSMAGEDVVESLVKKDSEIGINLEDGAISEIILDENRECQIRGKVVDVELLGMNDEPLFITIDEGIQNHYYPVKKDAFYVFEKNQRLQITPYDRCFDSKPILNRFLSIVAGPVMNLILAMVIYLIVAFITGVPNYGSAKIGSVSNYYPATDKLQNGDIITSVNGQLVDSWSEFSKALDNEYAKNITTITIGVNRNGEAKEFTMETYTYITSIGLSNIQAKSFELVDVKGFDAKGLEVGNVAIRYKGSEGNIEYGDIITKVKVDFRDNTPDILEDVTSWGRLIEIFRDVNIADIQFEYYSYNEDKDSYTLVSLDDCKVIEPYTNEVLNNQRIEKISQMIGVAPTMHFDLFGCIASAGQSFWNDFTLIFRTLKLLIAPSDVRQVGVSDLSSFVGIFSMIETYIAAGLLPLLSFCALLSVNIGVMNLLPIPALDGGRLMFLLYELITKKKPSKKVESIINNTFFILLMIFFVYVTFNDILRLF